MGNPENEKKEETEKNQNAQVEEAQGPVTLERADYDALMKRISELEALKERLMHAAADFENAKKRLMRERDEFVKFSQEKILKELLPVLDNFERALSHAGDVEDKGFKNVVAGIEMVQKQLLEILKSQGLLRLKTVGEKFDPHLHEAISYVQEKGPEDVIVDEIQSGYQLHERLLRAAKVRVRIAPSNEEEKLDDLT